MSECARALAYIRMVLEQVIHVAVCNRMLPKYNVAATLQVSTVVHMLLAFLVFESEWNLLPQVVALINFALFMTILLTH